MLSELGLGQAGAPIQRLMIRINNASGHEQRLRPVAAEASPQLPAVLSFQGLSHQPEKGGSL